MRWIRALDKLPAGKEEVLLRCRTIVYLAVFDPQSRLFLLKDGGSYDPAKEELFWTELSGAQYSHFSAKT